MRVPPSFQRTKGELADLFMPRSKFTEKGATAGTCLGSDDGSGVGTGNDNEVGGRSLCVYDASEGGSTPKSDRGWRPCFLLGVCGHRRRSLRLFEATVSFSYL